MDIEDSLGDSLCKPRLLLGVMGQGMSRSAIVFDISDDKQQEVISMEMTTHNATVLAQVTEFFRLGLGQGFLTEEGIEEYQKLIDTNLGNDKLDEIIEDQKVG